jgi:hypothetical protein
MTRLSEARRSNQLQALSGIETAPGGRGVSCPPFGSNQLQALSGIETMNYWGIGKNCSSPCRVPTNSKPSQGLKHGSQNRPVPTNSKPGLKPPVWWFKGRVPMVPVNQLQALSGIETRCKRSHPGVVSFQPTPSPLSFLRRVHHRLANQLQARGVETPSQGFQPTPSPLRD